MKVGGYLALAGVFGVAYGIWSVEAFRWLRGSAWLPLAIGGGALIYMIIGLGICYRAGRAVDARTSQS